MAADERFSRSDVARYRTRGIGGTSKSGPGKMWCVGPAARQNAHLAREWPGIPNTARRCRCHEGARLSIQLASRV